MSGVTTAGFERPTLDELKADLETRFKAKFGESIDVSPQSNFGQLIGVMADMLSDVWAEAHNAYLSLSPDSATGVALDNVAGLTGTVRLAATSSTATLTATGTATTVLPAGRVVSVSGTGVRFETLAEATIASVSAWVNSTAYTLGQRVRNGGNVYECITAGTSAGSGGPTTTAADITDNTAHWTYLGAGTGAVDVEVEAEETGPKVAAARSLTVIETPVAGWSNAINLEDATPGRDQETDAALHIRRESELRAVGSGTVEAIRTALLGLDGVLAARVFENRTDATDGDGRPPHSFEALVQGGTNADIAKTIWEQKPAGIAMHGAVTENIVDSQGNTQAIKFSRPTTFNIYIIVTLTKNASVYPSDGDAQVKQAIVDWGDAQTLGKDVVASAIVAQVFSIPGVLDASVLIGTTNPPVASTTISIGESQLALYDTSRITVNASNGTP